MYRIRTIVLIILTSILFTACTDEPTMPEGQIAPAIFVDPSLDARTLARDRPSFGTDLTLVERFPGFAGYYLDPLDQQRLVVNVAGELSQHPNAEALVRGFLRRNQRAPNGMLASFHIDFAEVEYSLLQLYRWREAINARLGSEYSVFSTGISRMRNRIVVGVPALAVVDTLARQLADAGIPASAVEFRQVSTSNFNSGNRLWQYQRPIVGGLSLVREGDTDPPDDTGPGCTAGFLAKQSGTLYLVMASHCTNETWSVDNIEVFQHKWAASPTYYVGEETIDPPGYTCGWYSFPFHPKSCRYSDAALVEVTAGVDTKFGYLARTLGPGECWWCSGTDTIDAANPYFEIIGSAEPFEGQVVNKIGYVTGWTTGVVSGLTDDFIMGDDPPPYHYLLDQASADYKSWYGDSGAPIFSQPDGNGGVFLLGLHNSNTADEGDWESDDESRFSRFVNIEEDLGQLQVVAPSEFEVEILGPSSISMQGTYTWTAQTEGGTGGYTYLWERRTDHQTSTCVYQTPWVTVGSGPEYENTESPFGYDFQLKLTVISGSESDTDNHWVSVSRPGMCPS